MKGKKIIKGIIAFIISCFIIYFGIYFYQNYSLRKSFSIEQKQNFDENFKFVRCNYNILRPEFAFVFPFGTGGFMSFEKSNNLFYQTKEQWDSSDSGTTTIRNTTFPELLKMVKEDCSQFQDSGSIGLEDDSVQWSYTQADPPKAPEEIEAETFRKRIQLKERAAEIRHNFSEYNEEQTQYLIHLYGDWRELTDEELIEFNQQAFEIYMELSDEQKKKLENMLK